MTEAFEVRLSRSAARVFEGLPTGVRRAVRNALDGVCVGLVDPSWRGGKKVKTIRGNADEFHRLRVGDYRVMYEIVPTDLVLLVLGIVHRRDLETWLRSR